MIAAGGQIQGARRRQEDSWHVERYGDDEILAIVADGLGGHPAGDVASREAVREFVEQFGQRRLRATQSPRQWLQDSTLATDACLQDMARKKRALREMATTLVVLYVHGDQFWAASVGDSYLLLLRDKHLARLNELHAEGGGVTSCVGFNLSRVDLADALPVAPGDRFLLATDGIVTLDDAEVTAFLSGPQDASTAVHDLLAAVEHAELPGQDNVTLVAVLV
jgi:PPM family protein phosphatase